MTGCSILTRKRFNRGGAEQGILTDISPYVYHVHAHDLRALRLAVQSALRNPIDSFVPPRMTWEAVCGYTASLLEHDWAKEMDSDRLSG